MSKKINKEKVENSDYIIENATGAVINTMNKGDYIVHKKQIEHCKDYIINFNKGESFVKIFDSAMPILGKKLSNPEFAFTMQLIPYVSYKDNILRNNDKILTSKEIASLLDMKYEYTRKIIVSLVNKGILCSTKTGCKDKPKVLVRTLVANPYIFIRGTEINRAMAGLFENNGWDKIDSTQE